ncbi:MAG: hypothetical protein LJE61_00480 [Thiocapsa sp.]|jgi:hypothetical protein|nr:hypothetical protein [Thiocapsa sp.]MCG6896202.1 hypothetical protein [Thiocapsa sp.]MCG6983666.1 hypothetical protein [Thiocapsa sp.]
MRTRILPVRTGWDPGPADGSFYPDGLPREWRLTYFANQLMGVLIETSGWGRAAPEALRHWRLDVSPQFRFYLRVGDAGIHASARESAPAWLGDRFGGWVVGADATGGAGPLEPSYEWAGSLSAVAASSARGVACEVPGGLDRDLRAARRWLDGLAAAAAGRPTLALMGRARIEEVCRWQSLVQLLGLA